MKNSDDKDQQPKRIKVLHLVKSLGRGGAEVLLAETLSHHNLSRFDFHYVYFLPWKDQMVDAIRTNGGTVTCLPATNNLALLLKFPAVIRYVRRNNIDIVHCHLPWAAFVGRIVAVVTGIPVVYTEHNKQERYHWLTRFLNRLTYRFQRVVIAVSEDVAASIHSNIGSRVDVRIVRNGVNTSKFARDIEAGRQVRESLGIGKDAIVVGTVAVMRRQKRLGLWIKTFAKAAASNPRAFAIIVGDGPLRGEIELAKKQSGFGDRIIMAGLQTDTVSWLSAMDIFLMTSEFEGLPIALLEAMSMECAVCTTNAGGIPEVITDGVHGRVVEVIDWQRLGEIVTGLCADEGNRVGLGKAARTRVEAEFSLRKMVTTLEQGYEEWARRGD